jgi:hypothetical protein
MRYEITVLQRARVSRSDHAAGGDVRASFAQFLDTKACLSTRTQIALEKI